MTDAPPISSTPGLKLTPVQWLVCVIAALGFAFDIYELLMLPLIVRPALLELGGVQPGTPDFAAWVGRLFYVPAIAGGIFGLLGGYLTDLFGRRRVLTFSILLYAFSAGFSLTRVRADCSPGSRYKARRCGLTMMQIRTCTAKRCRTKM